jgi:hypothetical protein
MQRMQLEYHHTQGILAENASDPQREQPGAQQGHHHHQTL